MKISVMTIFPEMFESVLGCSILGRAIDAGHVEVSLVNIRDFSTLKHKNTDDYPYGGGAGMVMLAQPVVDAIESVAGPDFSGRRILLSPRGKAFDQSVAERLAGEEELILVCGHYEGLDQRAIDIAIDEEISVGDYILTGGELGAMIIIDAVARLLPGVLGCGESSVDESFTSGMLEYPHYTRPRVYRGLEVPEVLLSGNHAEIDKWRAEQALMITRERRPDLLDD